VGLPVDVGVAVGVGVTDAVGVTVGMGGHMLTAQLNSSVESVGKPLVS
jgi:hypothetical protein